MSFKSLEKKYNIKISLNIRDIPHNFFEKPTRYKRLPREDHSKTIKGIDIALSKYNIKNLHHYIKRIFVVKEMKEDYEYGGAALNSTIIIAINKHGVKWISQTVHHEINHLIVDKSWFNYKYWNNLNYSFNAYSNDSDSFFSKKYNKIKKPYLKGFVNNYSLVSISEDVAEIAGVFFEDKNFLNKNKVLKNKSLFLENFYNKLNLIKIT